MRNREVDPFVPKAPFISGVDGVSREHFTRSVIHLSHLYPGSCIILVPITKKKMRRRVDGRGGWGSRRRYRGFLNK